MDFDCSFIMMEIYFQIMVDILNALVIFEIYFQFPSNSNSPNYITQSII